MSSRAAADVDIRTSDFELLPLEIGNIGIGNNSTLATLRNAPKLRSCLQRLDCLYYSHPARRMRGAGT